MKRIVLTGGGTAGHVTPNLALIPLLLKDGWDIHYIGTADGIERRLIEELGTVTYHCVHSGKLRRYFDLKNFTDPFKVLYGAAEAVNLMRKLKPDVLFSKGGFVSVPVVYGAWLNRVPAVLRPVQRCYDPHPHRGGGGLLCGGLRGGRAEGIF